MMSVAVVCAVFFLMGSGEAQVASQTQEQSQSQGQEQDRTASPRRQVIQWENNGQLFSLVNSGAEYVPGGAGGQERAPRVILADPRPSRRRQGGNLRRQAPPRGSSETVRGQARHPFGFGQVPDNWRQTTGSTGTSQFHGSSNSHRRPSSSSFSSSSYNIPSYPQYPFPQQPPFQAFDGSFPDSPVRNYEPPFQPVPGAGHSGGTYGTGQGYTPGGYGGGQGSVFPGSPSEIPENSYYFYQWFGYEPNPMVPASAPQPPFSDGLDHRYTHSLFNGESAPANPVPNANQALPVVDRPGVPGQSAVRSPQYEQFPPFGRPQPPFLQPFVQHRTSLNSAPENSGTNVGNVYRGTQRGML